MGLLLPAAASRPLIIAMFISVLEDLKLRTSKHDACRLVVVLVARGGEASGGVLVENLLLALAFDNLFALVVPDR